MNLKFHHILLILLMLILLPLILRILVVGFVIASLLLGGWMLYKIGCWWYNKHSVQITIRDRS